MTPKRDPHTTERGARLARLLLIGSTLAWGCSAPGSGAFAAEIRVEPGQSVNAAMQRARPGDHVVLADGTYNEGRPIGVARGVTLRAANPGKAVVWQPPAGGEDDRDCIRVSRSDATVRDLVVRGCRNGIFLVGRGNEVGDDGPRNIKITGNLIHDIAEDCIKLSRVDGVLIADNTMVRCAMDHTDVGRNNGVNQEQAIDGVAAVNVRITRNLIDHTDGKEACITGKMGSENWEIDHNHIRGCMGHGISIGGWGTMDRMRTVDGKPVEFMARNFRVHHNVIASVRKHSAAFVNSHGSVYECNEATASTNDYAHSGMRNEANRVRKDGDGCRAMPARVGAGMAPPPEASALETGAWGAAARKDTRKD